MQISKISFSAPVTFGKKEHKQQQIIQNKTIGETKSSLPLTHPIYLTGITLSKDDKYVEKNYSFSQITQKAKLQDKINDFSDTAATLGVDAIERVNDLYNISRDLNYSFLTFKEAVDENDFNYIKKSGFKYEIDSKGKIIISGKTVESGLGPIKIKIKIKNTPNGSEIQNIQYKDQDNQVREFIYKNGDIKIINIGVKTSASGDKKVKERFILGKYQKLESYSKDIIQSKKTTKIGELISLRNEERVSRYMKDVVIDNETSVLNCKQLLVTGSGGDSQVYSENATITDGRISSNKIYMLMRERLDMELKRTKA